MKREGSSLSLTINYLPTKFSSGLLRPDALRKRKSVSTPNSLEPGLLKQGGGVDAFKTGIDRIPGQADEDDEDGIDRSWFGAKGKDGQRQSRKLRWNRFKWMLFIANSLVLFLAFYFRMQTHYTDVLSSCRFTHLSH